MSEPNIEGQVLLGRYRVERELGRGGMGYVVAARHLALDELVAIKMVLREHAQTEEVRVRFLREARVAAKIASEHVVRVMDVGCLPSGEPFMVMELLKGEDLEQLVRRKGPLPICEVVDYVLQAIEAVSEAHAAGIVHRDLKPANLFLTRRRSGAPCVKVLDFGISKFSEVGALTGAGMTSTQGLLGSPLYMSPEQLQSARDVDGRTDIWALGVILYQLLANQFPFAADTLPQLLVKVLSGTPPRLRGIRHAVPENLESVVMCCLEKDRDDRFSTVTALAHALLPFGSAAARVSLAAIENVLPLSITSPPAPRSALDIVGDDETLLAAPAYVDPPAPMAVRVPPSTLSPLGGTRQDALPTTATPRKRVALWAGAAVAVTALTALGAASLASHPGAGTRNATGTHRASETTASPEARKDITVIASESTSAPPTVAAAPPLPPIASSVVRPANVKVSSAALPATRPPPPLTIAMAASAEPTIAAPTKASAAAKTTAASKADEPLVMGLK